MVVQASIAGARPIISHAHAAQSFDQLMVLSTTHALDRGDYRVRRCGGRMCGSMPSQRRILRVASQSKPASAYSFFGRVRGRPGLPPTAGKATTAAESPTDHSDWPRPRESPAARRRGRPTTCISSLVCGDRQDLGRSRRRRQTRARGCVNDRGLWVQCVFVSQHGQKQLVKLIPNTCTLPGLQPAARRFATAAHLFWHIFPATPCDQENHMISERHDGFRRRPPVGPVPFPEAISDGPTHRIAPAYKRQP